MKKSQLYNSWRGMRDRCRRKSRADAKYYSMKGITFCPEWDSFDKFSNWAMRNGYQPGLTIDRIDGNKNYCPENCRWVNRKTQGRNLIKNRMITVDGNTFCISEWAEICGISPGLLLARIDRLKWSHKDAVSIPAGVIPTGPKPRDNFSN